MSTHRYGPASLRGDWLRAGSGAVVSAAVLALVHDNLAAATALAGSTALFVLFAARVWMRGRTMIEMTEHGIAASSRGFVGAPRTGRARVAWRELRHMRLRYFSTKRDRSAGWMELSLTGGDGRLTLDSTVEGFHDIVRRAVAAAATNELRLNAVTLRNIGALGIGREWPRAETLSRTGQE
ncbi:MAG: hypothetical protein ACREGL_02990 [Alphaproteobacteria bacterium]